MDQKKVKEFVAFLKSTDLHELVWEKDGASVTLRRDAVAPKASETKAAAGSPKAATAAAAKAPETPVIRSTMVGTFYRSDSTDRPPFVVEGTVVAAGQPVGAIEAMKIMKDVVAPMPCKIVKALVANGHAVEYGQPLFEVEPQ